MDENQLNVETIQLRGGALCLDFTNTVEWRGGGDPVELLLDYPALVAWGRRVRLLSDSQLVILMNRAKKEMELAEAVLNRSVALREALYRLFSNIARNKIPPARDLDLFNRELAWAASRSQLIFGEGAFTWDWTFGEKELDILGPVIYDALLLLSGRDLGRIRKCEDRKCGWLFLDRSRNRSRRWCSMQDCGNRSKARRFYRRLKKK